MKFNGDLKDDTGELERLEGEREKIVKRIFAIRGDLEERACAELVGRFFRYRNSYSVPESPADYWWVWRSITKSAGDTTVCYVDFSIDSRGQCNVEKSELSSYGMDGWDEVHAGEYEIARKDFIAAVTALVGAS